MKQQVLWALMITIYLFKQNQEETKKEEFTTK